MANKEKTVPLEWINEQGNDIEQPLMDLLAAIDWGRFRFSLSNGLPVYFKIGAVSRVDGKCRKRFVKAKVRKVKTAKN